MGWFEDLTDTVTNPVGYGIGQVFGQGAKDKFNSVGGGFLSNPGGPTAALLNKGATSGIGLTPKVEPDVSGDAIPDFTNQWEGISQGLNSDKLQQAQQDLQGSSNAALSNAQSNLSQRGGLSAGANERLADANMQGFQNSYADLATKYGLGSAEISKQAIEKKQDLAQNIQVGKERAGAIRAGNKGGLLSFLPGFGG